MTYYFIIVDSIGAISPEFNLILNVKFGTTIIAQRQHFHRKIYQKKKRSCFIIVTSIKQTSK